MKNVLALEPREGGKRGNQGEWQKGDTTCLILSANPFKRVSVLRAWMSIVLKLISFLQSKRKLKIFVSTETSFH